MKIVSPMTIMIGMLQLSLYTDTTGMPYHYRYIRQCSFKKALKGLEGEVLHNIIDHFTRQTLSNMLLSLYLPLILGTCDVARSTPRKSWDLSIFFDFDWHQLDHGNSFLV
jgi:hypothetical protein